MSTTPFIARNGLVTVTVSVGNATVNTAANSTAIIAANSSAETRLNPVGVGAYLSGQGFSLLANGQALATLNPNGAFSVPAGVAIGNATVNSVISASNAVFQTASGKVAYHELGLGTYSSQALNFYINSAVVGYFTTAGTFVHGNSTVNVAINSTAISLNGSVGSSGQVLASNGTGLSWGSVASSNIQTFTASGTWNKPASGGIALIEAWGAGGGGRGNAANTYYVGSGGGGGGYRYRIMALGDLTSTVSVTIGLGGSGGTNANGTNGGSSSFGSYLTAYGGQGGNAFGGGGGTDYSGVYTAGGLGGCCGAVPAPNVYSGNGSGGAGGVPAYLVAAGLSVYGGAGGGAANTGSTVAAGTSQFAGSGGAGGTGSNAGGNGGYPAGGAGGSWNGTGGTGANGYIRVTVF